VFQASHIVSPLLAGLIFIHPKVVSEGDKVAPDRCNGVRLPGPQAVAFQCGFVGGQPVEGVLIVICFPSGNQRQDPGLIPTPPRCHHVKHHGAASALVNAAIAGRVATSVVTLLSNKITQPGDRTLPFRPTAKDSKDVRGIHGPMLVLASDPLA